MPWMKWESKVGRGYSNVVQLWMVVAAEVVDCAKTIELGLRLCLTAFWIIFANLWHPANFFFFCATDYSAQSNSGTEASLSMEIGHVEICSAGRVRPSNEVTGKSTIDAEDVSKTSGKSAALGEMEVWQLAASERHRARWSAAMAE
jgi:hypothetical protein